MTPTGSETALEQFATAGFALIENVVSEAACIALAARATQSAPLVGRGNLLDEPWCATALAAIRAHPLLEALLVESPVAVQCTYFAKSDAWNWAVPLHQDLVIPVAQRVPHPALCGWSMKEGALFVTAPHSVLERSVALRLHLDDCGAENGPLLVVPGSHRSGIVSAPVRADTQRVACVAPRGAALAMRPLLLHSSNKTRGTAARRILHFLFGPSELPFGLEWHHAV